MSRARATVAHEGVPGYLIVQFREPGNDAYRRMILRDPLHAYRVIHHAPGSLLWLVQVNCDFENEVRQHYLRFTPQVQSVSSLTLHVASNARRRNRKKR
jgi:hypothetical protein